MTNPIAPLAFAFVAATFSVFAPLYVLLLLALVCSALPFEWLVGGTQVGPEDIALLFLIPLLLVRARGSLLVAWRGLPYRRTWLLLVILSAVAYSTAPTSHQYFTTLPATAYQILRYSIRELMFYPLAAFLLVDKSKVTRALVAVLLVVDCSALLSVWQGWQDVTAHGLFDRNVTGSVYLLAFLSCLVAILSVRTALSRMFILASLLLMLRALLFAGSRGSWAGIAAGSSFLLFFLVRTGPWRRRLVRWSGAALVAVLLTLVVKPDLFDRPNVQRLLTLSAPMQEDTFNWRREVAWPHFWNLALQNPWLGRGVAYDLSLGQDTNTPHNSYLAIAVSRGFPVLALYLFFSIATIAAGLAMFRKARDDWFGPVGLVGASFLVGIWLNGVVDTLLEVPFTLSVLWMVQGVVLARASELWRISGLAGVQERSMPKLEIDETPQNL